MIYQLYTDGACQPNPGTGGWAFVLLTPTESLHFSGAEMNTTNNRMEMMAVVKGMSLFFETTRNRGEDCQLIIFSDSKYLVSGINEWMGKWKRRGWKKFDGKPVLNQDLWEQIDHWKEQISCEARHVRGHSGDKWNEECDKAAVAAAQFLKSQQSKAGHNGG